MSLHECASVHDNFFGGTVALLGQSSGLAPPPLACSKSGTIRATAAWPVKAMRLAIGGLYSQGVARAVGFLAPIVRFWVDEATMLHPSAAIRPTTSSRDTTAGAANASIGLATRLPIAAGLSQFDARTTGWYASQRSPIICR